MKESNSVEPTKRGPKSRSSDRTLAGKAGEARPNTLVHNTIE